LDWPPWHFCEHPERPLNYLENSKLWRTVLLAMLIPLAFVAYWPSPVDQPVQGQLSGFLGFLHSRGIPGWFNYQFVEASANVALFVPLGAVAALAFAEKRWWQTGAFGLIVSGIMELGQLLFLHNRFASPLDLVTNIGGAVIGALLAAAALKQLRARHLPVAGP
jgi:VanZ family protein